MAKAKATAKAKNAKTAEVVKKPAAAHVTTNVKTTKNGSLIDRINREVSARALVAELGGVFVLTTIAMSGDNPFFMGLAYASLAFGLTAISGAQLNPAVSFALWATKKLPGINVPFFVFAQFVGALAAVVVNHLMSGEKLDVDFATFGNLDWRVFTAEAIGGLVLAFGVLAAVSRGVNEVARAFGVGLALVTALTVSTMVLAPAVRAEGSKEKPDARLAALTGTIVNPAIASALTQSNQPTADLFGNQTEQKQTKPKSRFTLETLLAPVVGGVLGGWLYLGLSGRRD